ncbi:uncharacterized protein LOC133202901 [Saccostrea echinata]|uniref:uncharacterized protein LOC133202901 n=1 Tax=Saccostrea echinata TaxID=191078 RepID=UPI002A8032F8|nr:uncharacterized protein LOC133202901 [Saccostrea echinata]
MNMKLCFILSFLLGLIRAGPTCMRCTDAADITDCFTNLAVCGDNEECYLEKSTGEDLSIRYNSGCRSHAVCEIMRMMSGTTGRKRLVNCAKCCTDVPDDNGPCNAKLCDLTPPQLQATCVVCSGVHADAQSCTSVATCPPNEVCFTGIRIVGANIRYVFGCYEERVCRAMLDNDSKNSTIHRSGRVIHGDQGTPICDSCCKGNRCNAADCFELRKNMTIGDFSNGSASPSRSSIG